MHTYRKRNTDWRVNLSIHDAITFIRQCQLIHCFIYCLKMKSFIEKLLCSVSASISNFANIYQLEREIQHEMERNQFKFSLSLCVKPNCKAKAIQRLVERNWSDFNFTSISISTWGWLKLTFLRFLALNSWENKTQELKRNLTPMVFWNVRSRLLCSVFGSPMCKWTKEVEKNLEIIFWEVLGRQSHWSRSPVEWEEHYSFHMISPDLLLVFSLLFSYVKFSASCFVSGFISLKKDSVFITLFLYYRMAIKHWKCP